jgi:hypothetical protein
MRPQAGKNWMRESPKAIAVFPVEGGPAKSMARPAIRPS